MENPLTQRNHFGAANAPLGRYLWSPFQFLQFGKVEWRLRNGLPRGGQFVEILNGSQSATFAIIGLRQGRDRYASDGHGCRKSEFQDGIAAICTASTYARVAFAIQQALLGIAIVDWVVLPRRGWKLVRIDQSDVVGCQVRVHSLFLFFWYILCTAGRRYTSF